MARIATMGIDCIDERLFNFGGPIELNKPRFGLYGSTIYADRYGNKRTGWLDFCYGSDYHPRSYNHGISYTLNKNTKIYTISNYDDYINLLKNYRYIPYDNKVSIDWNKFKLDFDAFHLTEDAFWELRMIISGYVFFEDDGSRGNRYRLDDFYCYDCETWILFNLDCINKGSIQNICIKYKKTEDYE